MDLHTRENDGLYTWSCQDWADFSTYKGQDVQSNWGRPLPALFDSGDKKSSLLGNCQHLTNINYCRHSASKTVFLFQKKKEIYITMKEHTKMKNGGFP